MRSFELPGNAPSDNWDAPTVAHDAGSVTTFSINHTWRTLLVDALKRLTIESTYNGTEAETYAAVNFAKALIEDLYNIESVGGDMPIGAVSAFMVTSVPAGWLLCDGSQYLRVDYPDLYAIIEPAFIVDADNFIVPDLLNRVIMGAETPRNPGSTGGTSSVTLTEAEMPVHDHEVQAFFTGGVAGTVNYTPNAGWTLNRDVRVTDETGGGEAHNNLQPFLTLDFYIRAG